MSRHDPRWPNLVAPTAMLAAVLAAGCDVNHALGQVYEARHRSSDLLVQFTKAADASNLAVMADTDEASAAFAKDAAVRTKAAQDDVEALRPILEELRFSDELRVLDAFR